MSMFLLSVVSVVFGIASFLVVLLVLRARSRSVMQTPSSRGLFRFNDGLSIRYVDPIEVMMSLDREKEYSPDIDAKRARNGHPNSIRIQCEAIKRAFRVVDYSGPKQPGLTVSEMTQLLYAFWAYVDLQKKSTNRSSISAESMDATSIESEQPTTNDLSPSGCSAIVGLQN